MALDEWHEKHEEVDRLEQHELEGHAPSVRRRDRLLEAGWRDWLWPITELGEGHGWDYGFNRGLLGWVAMSAADFVKNADVLFQQQPVVSVTLRLGSNVWQEIGSNLWRDGVLHDAALTTRGHKLMRVPGPIFPHLRRVGVPCTIRGSQAKFARRMDGLGDEFGVEIVSRACVNFGRQAAGLPALAWGPLTGLKTFARPC
jgi:hypothetical protein